jgi:hypothetical protein
VSVLPVGYVNACIFIIIIIIIIFINPSMRTQISELYYHQWHHDPMRIVLSSWKTPFSFLIRFGEIQLELLSFQRFNLSPISHNGLLSLLPRGPQCSWCFDGRSHKLWLRHIQCKTLDDKTSNTLWVGSATNFGLTMWKSKMAFLYPFRANSVTGKALIRSTSNYIF